MTEETRPGVPVLELISFTRNHQDLSTELGYQFRFYCDRCQNGHLSPYQASKTGVAGAAVRTAARVFGGIFNRAQDHAHELRRLIAGPEHDSAFRGAVEAAKLQFKRCPKCTMWVCEGCQNRQKALCVNCAPELQVEKASAQATVAKTQVWRQAEHTDFGSRANLAEETLAVCPKCGAKPSGSKFCSECGESLNKSIRCPECKAALRPGMKFCGECGRKMER